MTRVLVHAHSTWSHDGHLPLDAYLDLAPRIGCSVVLLSEHEETGWTPERYDAYARICASLSTPSVRLIPGIEFNQQGHHLLCYGLRAFPRRPSPTADLAADVHRQGCRLTLAHPCKSEWWIPSPILDAVDAIEIWNSKWIYDGEPGPHPRSRRLAVAPQKDVLIGQDVHKVKHLSPLVLVTYGSAADVLDDIAYRRYHMAWRDRHWSQEELLRDDYAVTSPTRARLHHVALNAALRGYRLTRQMLHAPATPSSWHGRRARLLSPAIWLREAPLPLVSVILPVRNEAAFIDRALSSVLAQDYPADRVEILVADGDSTDGTQAIVRDMARIAPGRVRLIDNPDRIVPTGLNAAIQAATGDVIVRVDGHCEIAPDYIRRAVDRLSRDGVECVGGRLDTIGETHRARVIAAAMSAPFGVGGSAFRSGGAISSLTDTVAFPAFTRAALQRAGPFDEELIRNQDDEYSYRLRRFGGRILLATDLHARYYSRATRRGLWRQCRQYGYWKVRVLQKHPWQMRLRQAVPTLFVASLAIALVLLLLTRSRAALSLLALILVSYFTAAIAASWRAARRTAGGWRDLLPWLPLTFATMHVAYGIGSLVGLVAFWRRWGRIGHEEVQVHARNRPILPPRHS
jgi:glycosyltransferase involved in cell wall biosynthesis